MGPFSKPCDQSEVESKAIENRNRKRIMV